MKKEGEVLRYKEQIAELKELKDREKEEEQIFRKTQILNK